MSIPSATINGGASESHTRHAHDLYETPPECTVALLKHLPAWRKRSTWEPACATGKISRVLQQMTIGPVLSTDIRPGLLSLESVDFLQCGYVPFGVQQIITNPPFNRSVEFIRHARRLGVPFALLLKGSYWHAAERRALFVETGPVEVCPLGWRPTMAPDRGASPTMEFLWTVWDAEWSDHCAYYPLVKPT